MANTGRLEKLQAVEQDINKMLTLASDAVQELSKDKPSADVVEYTTKDFLRTLDGIEKSLSEHITYLTEVSTTLAHEGSAYGVEKDYELMCLQATLAKAKLQRYTLRSQGTSNGTEAVMVSHSGSS